MHSLLTAPGGAAPTGQPPRTRGSAPLSALALFLLMLCSALPGFAQSFLSSLSVPYPTFVAIDRNRTIGGTMADWLYVSNHGDNNEQNGGSIYRFNLTSGSTTPTIIATRGIAPGQFESPDGILIDAATGDLIISDRAQDRIQRITNTGTPVWMFGSNSGGAAADEMHGPCALAMDTAGALYIAEHGEMLSTPPGSGGSFVSKYTLSGSGSSFAAAQQWRVGGIGTGNGQFNNTGPYGVAVSGSTLFVTDAYNARVQTFDLSGNYQSQFSIPNTMPLGIYLDSVGALWIAETSNQGSGPIQQVQKYTTAGAYANVTLSGNMSLPFDTAIDGTKAYVSSWATNAVDIFDLSTSSGGVPVINSSASASGTVGQAFSYTITATNSPTSYAVSPSTPLPAGLSLSANVISGTPTTAGTTTVNLTATNGSGTSAPFTLTITIAAAPPPGSGPVATQFTYVAHTLTFHLTFSEPVTGVDLSDFIWDQTGSSTGTLDSVVQNDPSNYTLNFTYISGAPGTLAVTLKSSGTNIVGVNSGLPYTGAGVYRALVPVTPHLETDAPVVNGFTAQDAGNNTVNFVVSFNKQSWNVQPSNVTINASSGVTTQLGYIIPTDDTGYHFTIPVSYTGSAGGTISVTLTNNPSLPTISDGNYNYYVGPNTSDVFTIPAVTSAPTITSATTATATVGTAFSYQITASGSPNSYAATGLTGTGLTLNTSTGLIFGTPTTSGTITSQLTATNSAGTSAPVTLTITVNPATTGTAPTITSATTATATVGTAFSYQITASGSPTSFAATGLTGTGLALNTSTGVISGTPTASGTITTQLTATNSVGTSAPVTLTITVNPATTGTAPTITSATTASATVGAAFSYQIIATGSPTSYAATALTGTGLTLNTSTGLISGTPTASGTITTQLTATNGAGTSAPVTLTVTVNPATTGTAPTITSATSATATVGAAFSYQIAATNSPTSYAATGITGTGLSLNATSGLVSGTPTTAGTITSELTATNSAGTSLPVTLTITVNAATAGVPVVSNATVTGTVGTAIAAVQVQATNSPTSFSASGLAAYGLSISNTGLISGTPTAAAANVAVSVTATNASGTSAAATITLNIAVSGGTTSAPVVTSKSVSGTVGIPMSFTVSATNSPTSWLLTGQPAGIAINASSGLISGTPSASGTFNATVKATNSAGTGTGTVTFTIAGSTPPPPPPPPPPVLKGQTVIFNTPTSAILINQPIQLGATSTSGGSITYTIISGNAALSGSTLTIKGSGPVVIRATQAGDGTTWAAASADATFTANKNPQTISVPSLVQQVKANASVTLAASASSSLPVTYTLVSGPATLSGNTLAFTGATGTVVVRASQGGDDIYSAASDVTLTFNVGAVGQQLFMGMIGSDSFAAAIAPDNGKGILLMRVGATGEAIVARFSIAADGSFSTTVNPVVETSDSQATPMAAASYTVSGTINNGVLSGSVSNLGNFSATAQPATGTTASYAGFYTAHVPGSASGDVYLLVDASGQAYVLVVTPTSVASGTGTVSSSGAVSVATSAGGTISGNVDPANAAITGSMKIGSSTAAIAGLSADATPTDRLINISSRLRVSGDDVAHSSIAGFVVTGSTPKQILIRAVGPSLSLLGITDGLADPQLQLYDSTGKVIASNDGWNNDATISAADSSVGAFNLIAGSHDSALLVTLAPGAYTAQVHSQNNGIVLIEAYDVAANAAVPTKQLVNLSTRGYVGTGENVLIGGFVVSGNEPKRLLIRAAGPSLGLLNVTGALTDPILNVYDAKGNVIAKNDNWGTPTPVDSTQVAASASDVITAENATGAFPFPTSSTDAAVIITLNPGNYSAIVSGAANSTGAAMVEVYEIPNP